MGIPAVDLIRVFAVFGGFRVKWIMKIEIRRVQISTKNHQGTFKWGFWLRR